jgi:hypothetical protein
VKPAQIPWWWNIPQANVGSEFEKKRNPPDHYREGVSDRSLPGGKTLHDSFCRVLDGIDTNFQQDPRREQRAISIICCGWEAVEKLAKIIDADRLYF